MIDISITIKSPDLLMAATVLAKAIIQARPAADPTPAAGEPTPKTIPEAEAPKAKEEPAPKNVRWDNENRQADEAPAAEDPGEPSAKTWEPGGGAAVEEPQPAPEAKLTLEIVRAAGVAAARAHGKPAVHEILKSLGVPGMTALTADQYPEFMRKLGELNA